MVDAPRNRSAADSGTFTRLARERRSQDFVTLLSAAVVIIAGLALLGAMSLWVAGFAVVLLVGFALAYFAATTGIDQETIQSTREQARQAERIQRAENERTFRVALINALPEPALYVDAQGKVEAANAAARGQFRFVGAEPLLTAVVRRPELLDAVDGARRDGAARFFEFVERGETDRYFTCVAAPISTADSRGVLVSMHDLTDIKRAEFARVDFLANASHELRTPLTSLAGFIETMRGPARNDPEAWDKFLDIMHNQAERMRRLISDLLSLSRIELIEHRAPDERSDIAAVVAEVRDALGPVAAERNISLIINGPSSAFVTGVRDELSQVAQNLIDNAIKYSAVGGAVQIDLHAGLSREDATTLAGRQWVEAGHMSIVTLPPKAVGPFVVLRVSDDGPGIGRQHLPRLSERFYRVDPGRGLMKGTGLGLAIVKHVVQRHRGELLVESEPGRGSAFGVVLPVAADLTGSSVSTAIAADAPQPHRGASSDIS
jgi:two-component system, OmpR family, phosphate regulon sensor histidine kinase PhoR